MGKMATYKEVFVDDAYDLPDLVLMGEAIRHESLCQGYNAYIQDQEVKVKNAHR